MDITKYFELATEAFSRGDKTKAEEIYIELLEHLAGKVEEKDLSNVEIFSDILAWIIKLSNEQRMTELQLILFQFSEFEPIGAIAVFNKLVENDSISAKVKSHVLKEIGNIYESMNQKENAMKYYNKSLHFSLSKNAVIGFSKMKEALFREKFEFELNLQDIQGDNRRYYNSFTELVDLSNLGLVTVPTNLLKEINPRILHLNRNQISKLDSDFLNLSNLHLIDLSQNKIKQIPKNSFNKCNHLRQIDLSNNLIDNLDYIFPHLSKLWRIHLNNNLIPKLPSAIFHNLPALAILKLDNNRIAKIDHDTFKFNHKLSTLTLASNELGKPLDQLFTNCPQLKHVDFEFKDR